MYSTGEPSLKPLERTANIQVAYVFLELPHGTEAPLLAAGHRPDALCAPCQKPVMSEVEDVACPFCEGEISPTAKKCRHCGEWVAGQCRKCGASVRGRWAAQSLCANCEPVAAATVPQVVQHIEATGGRMLACNQCGFQTMHLQRRPNHTLHLLLTVFTVGVWLPAWALVCLFNERPRCTICGKKH